jgi:hypothetical protein
MFDAAKSVQAYVDYKTKAAEAGNGAYGEARTRYMQARAEAAEMERLERASKSVPADEVQVSWGQLVVNARQRLLAIPSRVAAIWSTLRTPLQAEAAVRELIHEALTELSTTEFVIDNDDDPANDEKAV